MLERLECLNTNVRKASFWINRGLKTPPCSFFFEYWWSTSLFFLYMEYANFYIDTRSNSRLTSVPGCLWLSGQENEVGSNSKITKLTKQNPPVRGSCIESLGFCVRNKCWMISQVEDETQVSRATQAEQDHYEMHVRAANIVRSLLCSVRAWFFKA